MKWLFLALIIVGLFIDPIMVWLLSVVPWLGFVAVAFVLGLPIYLAFRVCVSVFDRWG